jgi:hypothetical protein
MLNIFAEALMIATRLEPARRDPRGEHDRPAQDERQLRRWYTLMNAGH